MIASEDLYKQKGKKGLIPKHVVKIRLTTCEDHNLAVDMPFHVA